MKNHSCRTRKRYPMGFPYLMVVRFFFTTPYVSQVSAEPSFEP